MNKFFYYFDRNTHIIFIFKNLLSIRTLGNILFIGGYCIYIYIYIYVHLQVLFEIMNIPCTQGDRIHIYIYIYKPLWWEFIEHIFDMFLKIITKLNKLLYNSQCTSKNENSVTNTFYILLGIMKLWSYEVLFSEKSVSRLEKLLF